MLNEPTLDQLVAMRCQGLATAFREYLDQPERDELSFAERFALMVDREWSLRQDRGLQRRLQAAKLRTHGCLEDINYRHPRHLDRSVMQRLATCRWVASHENVLLTGPTGIGKTWLACALANQACRNGHTAYYLRVPRLLQELHISRADGSYARSLARLARMDVLILDDWGLGTLDESQRRDLLEVVEDRCDTRSTIVTSQLPVTKWHDLIGDPTVADSILDRLIHRSHKINLTGRSMRGEAT